MVEHYLKQNIKRKINVNNTNDKKQCKICLWKNSMNANYCEQCGYRFISIFKALFLLKFDCKHINQKFRYCFKCGYKLNYHYKMDSSDNRTPNPYTDENIKKIRKKWYQFWR